MARSQTIDDSPDSPYRALVIEEEKGTRKLLRTAMEAHEYEVVEASTIKEGMELIRVVEPELIILNPTLPDGDGVDTIGRLRKSCHAPMIVVSSRSRDEDKIRALDAGADDYLTKPFSVPELLARIRLALRHTISRTDHGPSTFQAGDLCVDLLGRKVTVGNKRIHLTVSEYRLLAALVRHPGRVLSYEHLLHEMSGPASRRKDLRHLQVCISRLRKKIEPNPSTPRNLMTEPGHGYRMADGLKPAGRVV